MISTLVILACVFAMIRNNIVHSFRIRLIHEAAAEAQQMAKNGDEEYMLAFEWINSIPSYDSMMWTFWEPLESQVKEKCRAYIWRMKTTRKPEAEAIV